MNHFRLDNLHLGCILTARGTFPNSDQWPAGSQPRGFLRSGSRALLCAASARARPCRYTFGPSCKQARKSPTGQETPTNKTERTVKANTKRQRHTSKRQEKMANWCPFYQLSLPLFVPRFHPCSSTLATPASSTAVMTSCSPSTTQLP